MNYGIIVTFSYQLFIDLNLFSLHIQTVGGEGKKNCLNSVKVIVEASNRIFQPRTFTL
jgi:hypothetical protein